MNIAIIGSGNVGGALAQQWIKAGHNVLIGAQFPLSEKNIALATKIGEDRFAVIENAVKQCEVILIATPPEAIFEILQKLGDASGKIIIDATNAIMKTPEPYKTVYHALADKTNAEVVKCFNTTGFENMLNPLYKGEGIDMFMAGDSENAKEVAKKLALDCGFGSCIDFGKSDKVELLEKFALSWINLAIMQEMGRDLAFKIIRR
ncbi:NADPH-dependent F420 reductase [Chryseobacterium cheonjiense]|uniref:NAD(P)-binding domain-containing protein n=1 Tax=Chryseobacterium cheonjiense TaxID=2728845 RepID=A0A7Y0A4R8_9FLAO|nr:NAD(P)-binding domain-containing protein [Chryseobacterium cheonjiense]NML56586.1 NAD(P)-binding domain-containing protein [Chryseobacterium cheonjiense]